ncbi:hypothetical protein MGH68_01275 [Erysipelothrix sp. D19-032]
MNKAINSVLERENMVCEVLEEGEFTQKKPITANPVPEVKRVVKSDGIALLTRLSKIS